MMGYGYGPQYNGMINGTLGWGVSGFFCLITWLVLFADLILVGMWLWKQINKK